MVYVDYPGPASLTQIYGTFNRAMLRLIPSLRTYAEPLTAAMVEFYTMSQVISWLQPQILIRSLPFMLNCLTCIVCLDMVNMCARTQLIT